MSTPDVTDDSGDARARRRSRALALGALGVVFGDIGTSPLYAIREAFEGASHELATTRANVLGILSLVFWSLIIVITIKYIGFVMRADNEGEGGILALTSLVLPKASDSVTARWWARRRLLVLIGIFGTALLYGDGMITPAISVLSAVEGAAVATPALQTWVIPIAVVILIGLFAVQRFGTGSIGSVFGPVMLIWFGTLAVLGLVQIVQTPAVLTALNPGYALGFFVDNAFTGFLALGSVFLVVTGGEALYADMGHFGRFPIALGWFVIVLPGLLLNYFGQGALLISDPAAIENPFFLLAPTWGLYPLTLLATVATVIASQALITGVFSLTMQATQLDYSPRIPILHTSESEIGQIYIPAVNWVLMVACVGLVIGFRSSADLASAYGVAVTTTMVITTILFYVVARERMGWRRAPVLALCAVFLVVDLGFFGANLFKIPTGGWFPLVVAVVFVTLMTTWRTGREIVGRRLRRGRLSLRVFVQNVMEEPPPRVDGTAVYMFSTPGLAPPALLTNFRYNNVLHEQVIVVSVVTDRIPYVLPVRRLEHDDLGDGFHAVVLRYGFKETPDVPRALGRQLGYRLGFDPTTALYFLGRESLVVTPRPGMRMWREYLFAFMSRNATPAANYFDLPIDQTVEVGTRVEL